MNHIFNNREVQGLYGYGSIGVISNTLTTNALSNKPSNRKWTSQLWTEIIPSEPQSLYTVRNSDNSQTTNSSVLVLWLL